MNARLQLLLVQLEDDDLTAAETAELVRLLAGDPAARRQLVEHGLLTGGIRRHALQTATARVESPRPSAAGAGRQLPPGDPSRRRWGRVLALAAGLALAVAGGLWFYPRLAGAPTLGLRVTEAGVACRVSRVAGGDNPAAVGMELRQGDRVTVANGAKVTLKYEGEPTTMDLHSAVAVFGAEKGAKRVNLAAGTLVCTAAPQKMPFEIKTPHAVARVVGTRFRLTATDLKTTLAVQEGKVAIVQGERVLKVGAGQEATATQNGIWVGGANREEPPGEGMPGQEHADARDDTAAKCTITIGKDIVSRLDIGIGWNDSSCVADRWPGSLGAGITEWQRRREFSPEEWERYFGLLEWSGCHWLRHAVSIEDWEPVNDNDDPDKTDWAGFAFSSREMQRHLTVLDQMEKRGIRVLLANWSLGPEWLAGNSDWATTRRAEEIAEALAALVHYLKREKKYRCVWALSLWNARNAGANNERHPDLFWLLYQAVDRQLRRLGVRDEILLLGPDASFGGPPDHTARELAVHGHLLDLVGDQDYVTFRGTGMSARVAAYDRLRRDLDRLCGKPLPFVITGFGNYGAGNGAVDDDHQVYSGALSTTAFLIGMINHGAAGLARWEFLVYGSEDRNWGALTRTDPDYAFRPYGPVFYPHAITARYVRPGWDVHQVQIENATTGQGPAICATALTSAKGDLTILLLNDETNPIPLRIVLDIPSPFGPLHQLMVRGPMPAGIVPGEDVPLRGGRIITTLPPQSIVVLTSLPPGDLDLPGTLALKSERKER